MPIRNDDPKTKQIEDLKQQVKLLTTELLRANQHIQFLSSLTGQQAQTFGDGLIKSGSNITIHNNYNSNVVAYIGKSQLPAIKTTRREDIDESPVILDGGGQRPRKNGSKNSTRLGGGGPQANL